MQDTVNTELKRLAPSLADGRKRHVLAGRAAERDRERARVTRPVGLPDWDIAVNGTGLVHTHASWFAPVNKSVDRWSRAIRASQFPRVCHGRFLLIENDQPFAGLGSVRELYQAALLVAMRDRRILVEIPLNQSWPQPPPPNRSVQPMPRWCDVPPFTFNCFFEPWTHCTPDLREPHTHVVPRKPGKVPRFYLVNRLPHTPPIVRMKASWLRSATALVYGNSIAKDAAIRHLFRPRPWVRRIGDCIMQRDGLTPFGFASFFIRHSPEKSAELAKLGHGRVPLEAFDLVLAALPAALRKRVFLQTSSAVALTHFTQACEREGIELSYTENDRSGHDHWAAWQQDLRLNGSSTTAAPMPGTVAAVNLYISSFARTFIAPPASAWTDFARALMPAVSAVADVGGTDGRIAESEYFMCCGCTRRDWYRGANGTSNLLVYVLQGAASEHTDSRSDTGSGAKEAADADAEATTSQAPARPLPLTPRRWLAIDKVLADALRARTSACSASVGAKQGKDKVHEQPPLEGEEREEGAV